MTLCNSDGVASVCFKSEQTSYHYHASRSEAPPKDVCTTCQKIWRIHFALSFQPAPFSQLLSGEEQGHDMDRHGFYAFCFSFVTSSHHVGIILSRALPRRRFQRISEDSSQKWLGSVRHNSSALIAKSCKFKSWFSVVFDRGLYTLELNDQWVLRCKKALAVCPEKSLHFTFYEFSQVTLYKTCTADQPVHLWR